MRRSRKVTRAAKIENVVIIIIGVILTLFVGWLQLSWVFGPIAAFWR